MIQSRRLCAPMCLKPKIICPKFVTIKQQSKTEFLGPSTLELATVPTSLKNELERKTEYWKKQSFRSTESPFTPSIVLFEMEYVYLSKKDVELTGRRGDL
jgi:hypothetical protein